MLPSAKFSRTFLRVVHRYMFFSMNLRDAFLTLFGKSENSIPFTVVGDPASVYINYRVKADKLEAFKDYINMPEGMELAPIQCLDGEEADYLLTANIYEVTGLTKGKRCEWSTYIWDENRVPRYLVLEARASQRSMDPIDFITPASRVEHDQSDAEITSVVESNEGKLFTSTIKRNPAAEKVRITGEWIEANDYIHWRNGVIDKTYYSGGLATGRAIAYGADDYDVKDNTHWADFVEAEPKHVLQCEGELDFSVVMWFNV